MTGILNKKLPHPLTFEDLRNWSPEDMDIFGYWNFVVDNHSGTIAPAGGCRPHYDVFPASYHAWLHPA